jgi:restriction system protein
LHNCPFPSARTAWPYQTSGTAHVFGSRVGWVRTYLKQASLLSAPRRGVFQITPAGATLLAKRPSKIDNALLNQYESFRAFRARGKTDEDVAAAPVSASLTEQTPEDAMAQAYRRVRKALEAELLEQVKAASPAFFERLVVDLLVAMGYGGSRQDAGRAIGKSERAKVSSSRPPATARTPSSTQTSLQRRSS